MKMTRDFLDLIIGDDDATLLDRVYADNLKQRKIVINQDIADDIIEMATLQVLKFNAEDKGKPVEERKPIILYLNSNGGDITSGFTLINAIQQSKTPVIGVLICRAYSMMSYILMSCHKRYSFKDATVLIHDGGLGVSNSSGKAKDAIRFYEEMDDHIADFVIKNTKIDRELYNQKIDREWYMFTSEAKELGIIDGVIGEDVDLDEVI